MTLIVKSIIIFVRILYGQFPICQCVSWISILWNLKEELSRILWTEFERCCRYQNLKITMKYFFSTVTNAPPNNDLTWIENIKYHLGLYWRLWEFKSIKQCIINLTSSSKLRPLNHLYLQAGLHVALHSRTAFGVRDTTTTLLGCSINFGPFSTWDKLLKGMPYSAKDIELIYDAV